MFLICRNRVLLGLDGFILDQMMGSQFRVFIFGLNIWIAWGDKDSDGNGCHIWLGFPNVSEVF